MRVEAHAEGVTQLSNALDEVVGKIHGFGSTSRRMARMDLPLKPKSGFATSKS
jgi:hypothetical protein